MNPDLVLLRKLAVHSKLRSLVRFFSMFPFWEDLSRFVSPLQTVDFLVAIQRKALEQRRRQGFSGNKDLLQLMLEAHEESIDGVSKLSDEKVTAQSVVFLVVCLEATGKESK